MSQFDKYVQLAKELNMVGAKVIASEEICFDIRAILKCRWGCEDYATRSVKCSTRDTSLEERIDMITAYQTVLLVHAHDDRDVSKAVLEIERVAFLDGHYLAFAVRSCKLCKNCAVDQGKACITPEKVRPCDQSFGIDVYKTVRSQGFPCDVLQNKTDVQNRYGFVLIE